MRLLCSVQAVCAAFHCGLQPVACVAPACIPSERCPCAAVQAREARVAQTPPANVDMLRHQFVMRSMETQPPYLQVGSRLDPDITDARMHEASLAQAGACAATLHTLLDALGTPCKLS